MKWETDGEHMSVLVCFLEHIFLSPSVSFPLSLYTHLHSGPTDSLSLSLSPSSPAAIGPTTP